MIPKVTPLLECGTGAEKKPTSLPKLITGKIVQGTCGWTDRSLISCRRFYPMGAKTSNDKLHHYSRGGGFGCVEVDSSTYAIPNKDIVRGWVDSTPLGFIFHFKAFAPLCYQAVEIRKHSAEIQALCPGLSGSVRIIEMPRIAQNNLWACFNDSISPAADAKKLGCVLFQFQLDFSPSETHRDYLRHCAERLDARYRMAVDFRNRDWLSKEELPKTVQFLKHLRQSGISLVSSDDLEDELFSNSHKFACPEINQPLPICLVTETCADCLYIRIHRRKGTNRILGDDEINKWSQRLCDVFSPRDRTNVAFEGSVFILWGTDHEDQCISNSSRLYNSLPKQLQFDWKNHTKEMKGGLLNAFKLLKPDQSFGLAGIDGSDTITSQHSNLNDDIIFSKKRRPEGSAESTEWAGGKRFPSGDMRNFIKNFERADSDVTIKRYSFSSPRISDVNVLVKELVRSDVSLFTWPSAVVLACYIFNHPKVICSCFDVKIYSFCFNMIFSLL